MKNDSPSARSRSRATLLLIAGLFVAPIVVAWLYASGVLKLDSAGRLNHGQFITPPVDIAQLKTRAALGALNTLPPAAWALLYLSPGDCDQACQHVMSELGVMKTLLGKEATRVTVFGLVGGSLPPQAQSSTLVHVMTAKDAIDELGREIRQRDPLRQLPLIVFLDWRGQIMMSFAPTTPPGQIKDDLLRLLKASAIR